MRGEILLAFEIDYIIKMIYMIYPVISIPNEQNKTMPNLFGVKTYIRVPTTNNWAN